MKIIVSNMRSFIFIKRITYALFSSCKVHNGEQNMFRYGKSRLNLPTINQTSVSVQTQS